jgi:hypothetical protein
LRLEGEMEGRVHGVKKKTSLFENLSALEGGRTEYMSTNCTFPIAKLSAPSRPKGIGSGFASPPSGTFTQRNRMGHERMKKKQNTAAGVGRGCRISVFPATA